jgi:hypothetical protein
MDHFGGLDVSLKETSICIVDDTGRIVKEVKVANLQPTEQWKDVPRTMDEVSPYVRLDPPPH